MPYRGAREEGTSDEPVATTGDRDLLPAAILLWLASLALCVARIARHRAFDAEATLAAAVVVALPYAVFRHIKKT